MPHKEVQPHFTIETLDPTSPHKRGRKAARILQTLFLKDVFSKDRKERRGLLHSALPMTRWQHVAEEKRLKVYLLCSYSDQERQDLIVWDFLPKLLLAHFPVKEMKFWQYHFRFETGQESYLLFEISLRMARPLPGKTIQPLASTLTDRMLHALSSKWSPWNSTSAPSLLSGSESARLISQRLISIMSRFPSGLDNTILQDLYQFFSLSSSELREQRSVSHIARVIYRLHLLRKKLSDQTGVYPRQRHLYLYCMSTLVALPFGAKRVVGMVIGVSLNSYEMLDDAQILLAVNKLLPGCEVLKESYYIHYCPKSPFQLLYIEVERSPGEECSLSDLAHLKTHLPEILKKHVVALTTPVDAIRNEEEELKHVVTLEREVRSAEDLPQVVIRYDEVRHRDVCFTAILAKPQKIGEVCIGQKLKAAAPFADIVVVRNQVTAPLTEDCFKEIAVLRISFAKDQKLLRANGSLNLQLARTRVVAFLRKALGEIRDYNGGLFERQGQILKQLKETWSYSEVDMENVEDFFKNLSPSEKQYTLPLSLLKSLVDHYLLFINAPLIRPKVYDFTFVQEEGHLVALLKTSESEFATLFFREFECVGSTTFTLNREGTHYLGYLIELIPDRDILALKQTFLLALNACEQQLEGQQVVRLSCDNFPLSLDPRLGGDNKSYMILRLLFEGLMRLGPDGAPQPALAHSVAISEDRLTYLFRLRPSCWCDGRLVTAHDFEYSWKTALSVDNATPFDYLFYPIKNAQAIKERGLSADSLGVKALDDYTLEVCLEHPAPFFLEIVSHTLLSPVSRQIDIDLPDWPRREGAAYLCNGPFLLKKSGKRELQLHRNPHYWDQRHVKLKVIVLTRNSALAALEMYCHGQNDWLGEPLRSWEMLFAEEAAPAIEPMDNSCLFWYEVNTQSFPFNNSKLRRALAYAIDRTAILNHLGYPGFPAMTPLSYQYTSFRSHCFDEENLAKAKLLFEEALQELGLDRKKFPLFTICYVEGDIRREVTKLVLAHWERAFGIKGRIQGYDWRDIHPKLLNRNFQICGSGWTSLINDPYYTLGVFKDARLKMNISGWENSEYRRLIDRANQSLDPKKRQECYHKAEGILLREMPVIPIFYEPLLSRCKSKLRDVLLLPQGVIDLKYASIDYDP